jgi:hypothetical protein
MRRAGTLARRQSNTGGKKMSRNLKVIGLALMAVGALCAFMAPGASAAETFHCEVAPCISTGTSEASHVFKAGETEVVCKHSEFKGTSLNELETSLTLHPTYKECTFLGETATVDTEGCNYVFGSVTNATKHLPVSIECTLATERIKVTTGACTLSFAPQTTVGGVSNVNLGSKNERDTTTVSTTEATFTKSGPLCSLVAGTKGTYNGPTTTKCYKDLGTSGPIDQAATTYSEGLQVGCWWE